MTQEAADPQPVRDELRQPHHPRAVAAAGQQPRAVQRPRLLDRARRAPRGRRVRRGVPRRRRRHLRHVPRGRRHRHPRGPADPEQRPAAARAGDGRRDEAPRLRHHVLDDLRAAVRVGPPGVDARPPHEGAGRLEHRHVSYLPNAARNFGLDGEIAARQPLRARRRVPRRPLQAVGGLVGRRRGRRRPRRQRLRRPGEDPPHRPRRRALQGRGPAPAVRPPAAHAGALHGDAVAGRHRVRRQARRGRLHRRAHDRGVPPQTTPIDAGGRGAHGRAADDVKFITIAGVVVAPHRGGGGRQVAPSTSSSPSIDGYLAHASLPWDPTASRRAT